MNFKAMIPVVIGVIVGLLAYDLVIKKVVNSDSYELTE